MRFTLLLLLCTLTLGTSKAQYYDSSPSLVFSAEGALPTGPLAQTHSIGGGGALKVRIPAGAQTDLLFTGNLAVFLGKTSGPSKRRASIAKSVSIMAGYRIYLNPLSDYSSFYLQGDAGFSAVTSKIINPVIAPSFGYLINDRIDLALRYQTILSSNPYAKISYISFGVGYGLNFH